MHSGGVLTARILERNCVAGTSIWKCFSPTVWTMALNAIMLISEISMMVIKDCYIELDFLKLDYGCFFTLVFVHGCTCTVCWNVVVVYWWGSFPLSVSNPIFREKLICCLLLYKIEAKISHNHRLYRHVLHSVTAWEFLVWWLPVLFCCYTLLWLVFTLYLLLTCAPSVLLPSCVPLLMSLTHSTHSIEVLPIPGLLSCEQGSAVESHLPFKASNYYLKPGLSE